MIRENPASRGTETSAEVLLQPSIPHHHPLSLYASSQRRAQAEVKSRGGWPSPLQQTQSARCHSTVLRVHVLPFSSDRCRRSHLWTRTACPKLTGSSRRSRRTSIPYPRPPASNPRRDRWPARGNSGQAQGDAVTWNHATPHPISRARPQRRRNPALRARLLRRLRP